MNNETGFGRRVLSVLEKNSIPFEHLPTGIDAMSVVVSDKDIDGKLDMVVDEMRAEVNPDCIEVLSDMALIATVGKGMVRTIGTSGRLFTALGKNNVNIRMIDQGSGELNIIIGVDTEDFEKAIRTIYNEFFN
jgi:aspartate kinase